MRKDCERQIRKEAKATLAVLLLIVAFWLAAGFGVARLDITLWHMPLWVFTGCIGTWLFAVGLVYFLVAKVCKDMELNDESDT